MRDLIKVPVIGHVKIYLIKNNEIKILLDRKNTILPNSKDIIAKSLANNNINLDRILVLKNNTSLAEAPTSVDFPNNDQVRFKVTFDENSFNDTLDELNLISSSGGEFSEITGISINKDDTSQLRIEWLLTIL